MKNILIPDLTYTLHIGEIFSLKYYRCVLISNCQNLPFFLITKDWDDKSSLKPDFFLSKARLVINGQMTETIQNGCAIKFLLNLVGKDSL